MKFAAHSSVVIALVLAETETDFCHRGAPPAMSILGN
jgi:hypothetical protein